MSAKLTSTQQQLVIDHLDLVDKVICYDIKRNLGNVDYCYDDLYQTGCMALCVATIRYDGTGPFKTFAKRVIRNCLLNYCKHANRHGDTVSFELLHENVTIQSTNERQSSVEDCVDNLILLDQFHDADQKYSGVTRKGIWAIELKLQGFSGVDIAKMYGVRPNQVSAWIARAKQRLRNDRSFLRQIS